MTDEQLDQAISMIPGDYWRLSCWTCREPGHVTFTCRHLSPTQRVFFAYCYYVHRVSTNPQLKAWYKQKLAYFQGMGPSPGPRPGGPNEFSGGGRGRGGGGRGIGSRLDNEYRMQQRTKSALSAPQANAGALPDPLGSPQTEQQAQVAVV